MALPGVATPELRLRVALRTMREEDAPAVIRRTHKRGEPDPLHGRFETSVDGKTVAGRETKGFGIMAAGAVRERLFFDTGTGMVLAREQLDGHGSVLRAVYFTDISFGVQAPRPPRKNRARWRTNGAHCSRNCSGQTGKPAIS